MSTLTQRSARIAAPSRAATVVVRASAVAVDRRQLLAGVGLLALAGAPRADAVNYKSDLCVAQDDEAVGDACRRSQLKQEDLSADAYKAGSNKGSLGKVDGVPVAKLDSTYVKSSLALMDEIEAYCAATTYNKERLAVIKQLRADANTWVAAYARGGSARSDSARKLYIAVDGVLGFLASNGAAPYPKAKSDFTLAAMNEAKTFLAIGK